MKVTLINTSDAGGGAPAACMRLLRALSLQKVQVTMLVRDKKTDDVRVKSVRNTFFSNLKTDIDFLRERLPFIAFGEKDKSVRFAFSTARHGTDVSHSELITKTDLLHIHWTNSGFLSVTNLKQIISLGKPIVWTLHDMWAFAGGCHYAGDCPNFKQKCGNCPVLRHPRNRDISRSGWFAKRAMYLKAHNIVFVTCSNWLADVAKQSSLLNGFRIEAIPNPIDTDIFAPQNKEEARSKYKIAPKTKVILFGAANINDRRKGIAYLVEALQILKQTLADTEQIEVLVFGKNSSFDITQLPFKTRELGIIKSQNILADIYSLADVYVLPSIEDNLPNMVMEALACGTPVAAFNTGGIPDMVEHLHNGYLAEHGSADDLAKGIQHILYAPNYNQLSSEARAKVVNEFSNEMVAARYKALYESILKQQ